MAFRSFIYLFIIYLVIYWLSEVLNIKTGKRIGLEKKVFLHFAHHFLSDRGNWNQFLSFYR